MEGYIRFLCTIFGENYEGSFKKAIDSADKKMLIHKIFSMVRVLSDTDQVKIISKFDLNNENESYEGDVSSIINKLKKYSKDLYHFLFKNISLDELIKRAKTEIPNESITKRHIDINNMNGYDYEQIGSIYAMGNGVPVNKELAYEWYLKAAEANEFYGCLDMMNCYENGIGVQKDDYEYFKWLIELITFYDCNAATFEEVAKCYELGIGTEVNKTKAKKYKDIAAKYIED